MEHTTKTDNFLKAIKKHTAQQKKEIQKEVEQIKEEKLKEAEKRAKQDSTKLIQDRLEAKKSEQTSVLAKKTREGQRVLFTQRAEMTKTVFEKAKAKLIEYTQTPAYNDFLRKSAEAIAKVFEGGSCIIYVNERDLNAAYRLISLFSENSQILPDASIKIGGLKGYCAELGIIADETLDSKLESQKEWFFENAKLSVL